MTVKSDRPSASFKSSLFKHAIGYSYFYTDGDGLNQHSLPFTTKREARKDWVTRFGKNRPDMFDFMAHSTGITREEVINDYNNWIKDI